MGNIPVDSRSYPELGFDSHISYAKGPSRQPAGCGITGLGTRSAASRADHESTLGRQCTSPLFAFQKLRHLSSGSSPR